MPPVCAWIPACSVCSEEPNFVDEMCVHLSAFSAPCLALKPKKPPPLPPFWDPAKAIDRLPQPYRMIDKLLAEIVEESLNLCLAQDKQKRVVKATHIDTVSD